jgi:hypothetical protein
MPLGIFAESFAPVSGKVVVTRANYPGVITIWLLQLRLSASFTLYKATSQVAT